MQLVILAILLQGLDGAPLQRSDLLDCSDAHHKFWRCIDGKQYGKLDACLFHNGYYDVLFSAQNFTTWTSNIADPNWMFARYCDEFPPLPPCEPKYDPTSLYLPLDTVVYNESVYTRIGPPAIGDPPLPEDSQDWSLDSLSCHKTDFLPLTTGPFMQPSRPTRASGDVSRVSADREKRLRRVTSPREIPTAINCSRYVTCPDRLIAWREMCVEEQALWIVTAKEGALLPANEGSGEWRRLAACSSPPELHPCYYPDWVRRRMYWPYDRVTFKGVQYRALVRHVNIVPGLGLDPPNSWPPRQTVWHTEHQCTPTTEAVIGPGTLQEDLGLPEIDCLYNETNLLRCLPKMYPAQSTCLSDNLLWTTNFTQAWPNSSSNGNEWYAVFQCENGMPELPYCNAEPQWDPLREYKALDKVVYTTYIWEARAGAQVGVPPLADAGEWELLTPCGPVLDPFPPTTTPTQDISTMYTYSDPEGYEIVDCSAYLDWFPWRQFNYQEIVRYFTPDGNYAWEVIWKEGAIRDYPPRPEYGWKRIYACLPSVVGDCDEAQIWSPTEPYIPTERVRWNDVLWEATAFLEVSEAPSLDNTSWKSIQQCEPLDNSAPSVVPKN